jgi:hypothetical protein
MADLKVELDKFLSKLGLSSKSLLRVRFGGVVGKQALVAVFVAIGLTVVSRQTTDPNVLRLCIYGLLVDAFFGFAVIAFHGHKHPLEATLEGGEVVAYRHVQQELAAKGAKEIVSSPPVLEGLGHKQETKGETR